MLESLGNKNKKLNNINKFIINKNSYIEPIVPSSPEDFGNVF